MIRKMGVQLRRRIFRRAQCSRLQQHDTSPYNDRKPNEGEKNHRGPKESFASASRLHDLLSLLLCIRTPLSIYNPAGLPSFWRIGAVGMVVAGAGGESVGGAVTDAERAAASGQAGLQ